MMDEFETNLAAALKSAAPTPPTEIEPAEITRGAGHARARRLAAPLVAALAVAAVALIVLATVHTTGKRSPAGGSQQPIALYGSWKLIDLQGFDGAAHTAPDGELTLRFTPGWIGNCFASTRVNVGAGTLQFPADENWVSRLPTGCPELGRPQNQFIYAQVLAGTTRWTIRGDQLTLSRDGAAALFQRVLRPAPAWARRCVPPSLGSRAPSYEGLTYAQAVRAARQQGFRIDVLCTNRVENIGQPMHTAGQRWIWTAVSNGQIIFARTRD